MKEINGFNDAMNFWRMLFKAPIRAIAVVAVLVLLWFDNGWIFHPIHSTISVVVTVLIMFVGAKFIKNRCTCSVERVL